MSRRFGSSMDAEGNFYPLQIPSSFKIPGTGLMVDIHGQPVGAPPPAPGLLDQVLSWVKANPQMPASAPRRPPRLLRRW